MEDESPVGFKEGHNQQRETGAPTARQEPEPGVLPDAPEHDLDYHSEPETAGESKKQEVQRSRWAHRVGMILGFIFIVVGLALNYAANIDTNIDSIWQGFGVALFVTGLVFVIMAFITTPIGEAPSEFRAADGQFDKHGKINPSRDERAPPPGEL